ncbi:hypothetical protein [Amycolatopsis sp. RTGN1]|uniref:hypothetical protein n=1 Tax=Amycolatopsis ponsaeliensis TaxID=2992142 RepID=UPI00254F113E|nr:hypothetical protein [Amycolatopsis sp. RTGN1]
MTTFTVHTSADQIGSAYEQACRLIETELGGRRIMADPDEPDARFAVCAGPEHLIDRDSTLEA